jgi:hypothetical protein
MLRVWSASNQIKLVVDSVGNRLESTPIVLCKATDYYRHHLNEDNTITSSTAAEDRCYLLEQLLTRLDPAFSLRLDALINETEVLHANCSMPLGRLPGPDGIPLEFYLRFHETLVPLLTRVFNICWDRGFLPADFLLGDVILLPKKGDPSSLHNKRPITLLNCKYKSFAKIWQLLLSPVAQALISWNQTVFILTRSIHHSVLFCSEVLSYARAAGLPTVFLQVDFCKA